MCYFATDIHSKTLGAGGDDSLDRTGEIEGELVMVSSAGVADTSQFAKNGI